MALFDDVKRRVLDNGLEILVREDPSTPVVALNFFARVGSLNEDDAIAGWSHGIEHMLFKGTERRGPGDIAREIANAGGETNAGTGYESTNYYITLPSRNFEIALDIHADVLRYSTFDEHELEKERQVLIKENEMYRDRPNGFGFTWEELLDEAFTEHRYKRPIGGPDENLLRVGRDPILKYKETYYVPNNITYVVVGDVKAEEVFQAIDDKFGDWPRKDLVPDTSPPEPPQTRFRFRSKPGDVEKSYVKIGFHVPPELESDTDALMVLAHILGSGRSSRLYRKVREEQGLILEGHTLDTTGNEPGYMVVEFTAEPDKADEAFLAVFNEILRFQSEPVRIEEVERTVRAVRSDTVYTLETMEGQAQMLGHYALLGDYSLAGKYLERISKITPAHIQEVAKKYLGILQATVFAYGPTGAPALAESPESLEQRIQDSVLVAEDARPAESSPVNLSAPSITGGTRQEVESLVLDAGTRVLLQPDGRLPLTAIAAYAPVGSGHEPASSAGITRLTQNCMMKGAAGRDAAAIAESIDRMGVRMRPMSSRDASGFSLSTGREDLLEAMDLFQAVLTQPEFPSEAVGRERDRTLVEIASLRDDTVQYTVAEFFRLLFPDHAYGRPSPGEEHSVRTLDSSRLFQQHQVIYNPARMVISAVGDFDRDELLARLESLVAALPRGEEAPAVPRVEIPSDPIRNHLEQDVSQAVVVLGYPGPKLDAKDRYALDVWEGILSGMGNRLFTRLRDEKHLCYFTGAFVAPFMAGGAVGAYVGTGPEQVEQATEALLHEIHLSAREVPTDEELERAKNNIAGGFLTGMQTRMSWASTYAQDEVLGLGYGETLRYVEEVQKVTPEMVREAGARYVDASRLAQAVLGPGIKETATAGDEA